MLSSLQIGLDQDVFVHFEPLGYTLQHEEKYNQMEELDLEKVYQRALSCARDAEKQPDKRRNEEMLLSTEIPHYIADVEKAKRWAQTHPRAKLVRNCVRKLLMG